MPSPPADDLYARLGVGADANDEQLREAFQQVLTAYAVLSDPIARAEYDGRRRAAERADAPLPAAPTSPPPRASRSPAPGVMLWRISGSLTSLLACGAARLDEPGFVTLVIRADEAAQGGMATVSLPVDLRCPDCAAAGARGEPTACARCGGTRTVRELFSAWLAVPPGVTAGDVLTPSVELPGTVTPVRFRVRLCAAD